MEGCWQWGWSATEGACGTVPTQGGREGSRPQPWSETPAPKRQVTLHGDVGGGEENLLGTVPGPPGAVGWENPGGQTTDLNC